MSDSDLKVLLGFVGGMLTLILGRMMTKKEKVEDKKELVCERHINRIISIEKENIRQDGQIENIQEMLREVRQDIKTLLGRL